MARVITEYDGEWCWTDVEQVTTLTGHTVTSSLLIQAQELINMVTGVYPERLPDDLKSIDRRRMENALCYQAAWMSGTVDLFHRVDTSAVSDDTGSATFSHANAQLYAPVAWREILALSWNNKSIRTKDGQRRFKDVAEIEALFLAGDEDADAAAGGYCEVPGRPFS